MPVVLPCCPQYRPVPCNKLPDNPAPPISNPTPGQYWRNKQPVSGAGCLLRPSSEALQHTAVCVLEDAGLLAAASNQQAHCLPLPDTQQSSLRTNHRSTCGWAVCTAMWVLLLLLLLHLRACKSGSAAVITSSVFIAVYWCYVLLLCAGLHADGRPQHTQGKQCAHLPVPLN